MRRFFKIYNFSQANFLFQEGCRVKEMGYNKNTKNPYIVFYYDNLFCEKMKEWQQRGLNFKKKTLL